MAANNLGVYLSVPFCRAKCSFCNFASGVGTAEAVDVYLAGLRAEIAGARANAAARGAVLPEDVDTVYLGGGTPSLLTPAQMQGIFAALRAEFRLAAGAEITMEAAPGQIEGDLLEAAMRCGVNRLSLGVQSFVDREAQAVGRSHTGVSCGEEFRRLRAAGVRNLGVDLIAGLPYQTEASFGQSLAMAAEGELEHVSVYMLEVDDESRLGREVLGGGARLHAPAVAGEESVLAMYEEACARLPHSGLQQYEISNFAREGFGSRHNERYWRRRSYVGFGLDAHSMLLDADGRAVRWSNADALAGYERGEAGEPSAWVDERAAFEETVFLGLRLNEGLRWEQMRGLRPAWVAALRETGRVMAGGGFMEMDAAGLRLTARGRVVSGEVFGELLCGVAA